MSVLSVSNIYKRFNLEAGFFARFGRFIDAVNGVSFRIGKNEAYGLVGESGCGKTTTARMLVRMYEADSGEIVFNDESAQVNISILKKESLQLYREKVRYIFQDPAKSLNPRMSVYEVLVSGCRKPLRKRGVSEKELREKASAILEEVGLQAADLEKRPSEFSGGQRQRISIARALLMEPEVLICDEVVSALDVSVQGQILNLLLDIRKKRNISFLFIAHDLKVACYFCDRIGVMYKGELMEEAKANDLYIEALHPYTRLLFSSASGIAKELGVSSEECGVDSVKCGVSSEKCGVENKKTMPNTPHSSLLTPHSSLLTPNPLPSSCPFAPRCPNVTERCLNEHPELIKIKDGHLIRCFNYAAPNLSSDNT